MKIGLPFTVEFDIHRNSFSSANAASIRIYNLSQDNRNQIRKDQFDYDDQRKVTLVAGYGDQLALAFEGSISQAWSAREGTNMVTQIESYDGGYAYVNAITNQSYPGQTQFGSIIGSLMDNLAQYGVSKGAVGDYGGQIPRGNSYFGSTTNVLKEITNGGFFIDNGKSYALKDDEALDGNIPLINAQSGLLGTPIKEQQFIRFDMLFEPSLKVAQLVRLESETANHFNGIHKVISLKHTGTISDAVAGTAVTSVGLLPGTFRRVPVG